MWDKSTFINSYAGKACAKTGNKPGVTRGNQWIRLSRELALLELDARGFGVVAQV